LRAGEARLVPAEEGRIVRGHSVLAVAVAVAATLGAACHGHGSPSAARAAPHTQAPDPWRADQVIEPEALARQLASGGREKPIVVFVGFPLLWAGGHIAGSVYVGPASRPDGLEALRVAARQLPPDARIVLYCGCCPWHRCPNIRPAFRLMQELGFKNVAVLHVADNLAHDWTQRGFPVERGR
jgi:thiosulfate/3-mercaptopyruvate sulfurtransferase